MVSILKIGFILLIVIFVGVGITDEIRAIDLAKTIMIIRDFSNTQIILLILWGIVGVSFITLYDFLIAKYLKLNIKPTVLFSVSFLASTVNNISGLGGLTGASIRSLLFKKDVNAKDDMVDYNLLLIPATAIGLSIMALITLVEYKYIYHIFDKSPILLIAIIIFFLYLIVYPFVDKIFYKMKKTTTDLNNKTRYLLKLKLILVSTLEWTLAYSLFLILVRHFDNSISILIFLSGIVLLASALVPGLVERTKIAAELLSFPILNLSRQLSIGLYLHFSKDLTTKKLYF